MSFEIENGVLVKYKGTGLETDIVIPDGVKSISKSAFSGCTSLTIYASAGSCAERYAKKHNIKFKAI